MSLFAIISDTFLVLFLAIFRLVLAYSAKKLSALCSILAGNAYCLNLALESPAEYLSDKSEAAHVGTSYDEMKLSLVSGDSTLNIHHHVPAAQTSLSVFSRKFEFSPTPQFFPLPLSYILFKPGVILVTPSCMNVLFVGD